MIFCAVDDLLFSVKLKAAAKAFGADIHFERTAEGVVPGVRQRRPDLVILDLNSRTLRPIEAIAALKADRELQDIPTLGYVAHVDAETVAAARDAGIDQVLARSAFVKRLGEILTGRA